MTRGVLVVGLGQIGMGYDLELDPDRFVLSHARAFSRHPLYALVGAVDPEAGRRNAFETAYSAPAFATVEEAIAATTPQVVVIATPTALHHQTLRGVLEAESVKTILCEKPLSATLSEGRAMVEACRERGISLFVNYIRRSDPGAIEVACRIHRGEIAGPVKGTAWYSKGFLHNGSHLFNLLQHWLGPMTGWTPISPGRALTDGDSEPDVSVAFQNGTVIFLGAREEDFPYYAVELVARNGRLRYDRGGERIEWWPVDKGGGLADHFESIPSGMDQYQRRVVEEMAAADARRPHRLCDGSEALATLEAMFSITGRE